MNTMIDNNFHDTLYDSVYRTDQKENTVLFTKEAVNHPEHYGGADNPYEAIKVIKAWNLDFCLGNTVKYISRAGKKDPKKRIEDLRKALWYLQQQINYEVLDELDRSTQSITKDR